MNGPIPFTDEQLYAMAAMYAAGTSIVRISEAYGISPSATRDRLLAMGILMKQRGAPLLIDKQTYEAVDRLRKAGFKWKMIANRVGHKGTVKSLTERYYRVTQMGPARYFSDQSKWSAYPESVLRCAKYMHDSGLTWPTIAKAFGASPTALNHAVMGVEYESCA